MTVPLTRGVLPIYTLVCDSLLEQQSLRVHSCTLFTLATAPRSTCSHGVLSPMADWYVAEFTQLVIFELNWYRNGRDTAVPA